MNVLITTPDLKLIGGVSSYYKSIQAYFPQDVSYITVGNRSGESGLYASIRRIRGDYLSLKAQLKNGHFDIVHLNPSLLPKALLRDGLLHKAAKAANVKTVIFMHGWDKDFERAVERKYHWLFKFLYSDADAFIVLAAEFKEWLHKIGITAPIYCETTVVDDNVIGAIPSIIELNRNQGPKDFNILYLSRLDRGKGLFEAIDSYVLLKSRYNDIHLTIAGDGPEMESAKLKSKNIEGIEFLGYVRGDEKHKAFLNADVYLFPSCYGEGMPISVLEAMAFGLPIITRQVGGIPDFFVNGLMGFSTESKLPSDFADYIQSLRETPGMLEKISKYNYRYARDHFTPKIVAERILNHYKSLIVE